MIMVVFIKQNIRKLGKYMRLNNFLSLSKLFLIPLIFIGFITHLPNNKLSMISMLLEIAIIQLIRTITNGFRGPQVTPGPRPGYDFHDFHEFLLVLVILRGF